MKKLLCRIVLASSGLGSLHSSNATANVEKKPFRLIIPSGTVGPTREVKNTQTDDVHEVLCVQKYGITLGKKEY